MQVEIIKEYALLLTKKRERVQLFTLKYTKYFTAGIAQLVERCLAKAKVASSSLVSRSTNLVNWRITANATMLSPF